MKDKNQDIKSTKKIASTKKGLSSVEKSKSVKDVHFVLPMRNIVIFPGVMVEVFVARAPSVEVLKIILKENEHGSVVAVAQKDIAIEAPEHKDLYKMGCLTKIVSHVELPDGTFKLLLSGEHRFKISKWLPSKKSEESADKSISLVPRTDKLQTEIDVIDSNNDNVSEIADLIGSYEGVSPEMSGTFLQAEGHIVNSESDLDESLKSYYRKDVVAQIKDFNKVVSFLPDEAMASILGSETLDVLIDNIAFAWLFPVKDKQDLLEITYLQKRYEKILVLLERELKNFKIAKDVHQRTREQIEKTQHDYFLNEQLKAIHKELGGNSSSGGEYSDLGKKISAAKLSKAAKEKINDEFNKLQSIPSMMPEASNITTYIEYLLSLPWKKRDKVSTDIAQARKILDSEHYGLSQVKDTILEFISVYARTKVLNRTILCFVGPPGVGKTSIAASIAKAMNRNYQRIALGGMHDEAEIRGHRRTYIGALPGKIIQRVKKSGVKNPMILLDEVDKLSQDFRGDPASALLEVLDPEQNKNFSDNYVEVEFDLSEVLFVCTANSLNIPDALRDRMEIIELSSYLDSEKIAIAEKYLLPKQKELNGLSKNELTFSSDALQYIIRHYTMEAGARSLERNISKICRKVLLNNIESVDIKSNKDSKSSKVLKNLLIDVDKVKSYLGTEKYNRQDEIDNSNRVGEVKGLAWTAYGGSILKIQASVLPNGRGEIIKTGSLGAVMQESIQSSISVVRKQLALMNFPTNEIKRFDLHIHLPDNATPKDGPSAGAALATAILSAFLQSAIRGDAAVTGEMSLTGNILPIGGLKEKLYAAVRDNIKTVIIPKGNQRDYDDVPQEIKDNLKVQLVDNIYEVWDVLFVRSLPLNKGSLHMLSGVDKVGYLPFLGRPTS